MEQKDPRFAMNPAFPTHCGCCRLMGHCGCLSGGHLHPKIDNRGGVAVGQLPDGKQRH